MVDEPSHQEMTLDPKQWRTMTDLGRYALIQRIQINHQRLKPLMTELDTYAYFAEQTETREPPCLAIVGEAGVGKTTCVQHWIRTATKRWDTASGEHPALLYLYTCHPALTTPKGILAACLSVLGDPHPDRGSERTMMERLQKLMRASSVRMLFVDKLQHLINRERQQIRYTCIELLEHLVRHMGVSVIFLGSQDETDSIFQVSPRLDRRVGTPRILHPFEWKRDEPETILEFRSLMRTIDLHLPFDLSGLDEEEMAYRFFYASDGIMGWIMKLISYAGEKAISMQAATLSRSLFASAYDTCIAGTAKGAGKINPFAT